MVSIIDRRCRPDIASTTRHAASRGGGQSKRRVPKTIRNGVRDLRGRSAATRDPVISQSRGQPLRATSRRGRDIEIPCGPPEPTERQGNLVTVLRHMGCRETTALQPSRPAIAMRRAAARSEAQVKGVATSARVRARGRSIPAVTLGQPVVAQRRPHAGPSDLAGDHRSRARPAANAGRADLVHSGKTTRWWSRALAEPRRSAPAAALGRIGRSGSAERCGTAASSSVRAAITSSCGCGNGLHETEAALAR